MKKIQLLVIACQLLCIPFISAQQSTDAAGGEASGSQGSVSYSVGQPVYTTATGTTGTVVTGVQQPYKISEVSGIETKGILFNASVYPNPTFMDLILEVEQYDNQVLWYQLIDMNGKQLQNKTLSGSKTSIAMHQLEAATYFLKVFNNNEVVKTFKIIKNQ